MSIYFTTCRFDEIDTSRLVAGDRIIRLAPGDETVDIATEATWTGDRPEPTLLRNSSLKRVHPSPAEFRRQVRSQPYQGRGSCS